MLHVSLGNSFRSVTFRSRSFKQVVSQDDAPSRSCLNRGLPTMLLIVLVSSCPCSWEERLDWDLARI